MSQLRCFATLNPPDGDQLFCVWLRFINYAAVARWDVIRQID